MLICNECRNLFEEGEQAVWAEERGEFQGRTAYEEVSGCPLCKGGYQTASLCKICDKWFPDDELTCGVCEECLSEYNNDFNTCLAVGEKARTAVEINLFLAEQFSAEEIESILSEIAKVIYRNGGDICRKFIEEDKDWFVEKMLEVKYGE